MAQINWTNLKKSPQLKADINLIISKLNQVIANDEKTHLADVGLIIGFISKDLAKCEKKAFEEHNRIKKTNH